MRILILILGLTISYANAQQVKPPFEAIEDFFEAFHNKDATVLNNAFSEESVMQRASNERENQC